jgi:cellulose synthase operon protein C
LKRVALFAVTVVCTCLGAPATNASIENCRALEHHGHRKEAASCFQGLTRSGNSFERAEGFFGLYQYSAANDEFRIAYKEQPRSALVKTEWGRLYLEHYGPSEAAKLFTEALESDPGYAPAYLGLAKVFAQRFDKRASDLAQEALKHDPKLAAAHELLAYLALEDNQKDDAAAEAQKALAISNESLDALTILTTIDWLAFKDQSTWLDQLLKINPAYGEAYATGGHFLEINYRYQDAIGFYEKALELNPDLLSARSKMGVDLMRTGKPDEAREQLVRCFEAGWKDAETVNSLRLLDRMGDYQTFPTANTELLLNKKEAALLRPYIQPELERAIATYERKYKMKLPGPVRLEVYPNHEDFVVRTLGLPGQGGLLGVTFGRVVSMDSPSSRPAGEYNWGSTMWHELSHVYVVTATHQRVPRWFTEGVAVHEEGAVTPDWGSRLSPGIVLALQKKRLLPVADLDKGFVRPQFPDQVQVSYFEAGKICDYIAEKWGNDAILGMIHSYADGKNSSEAISENLHLSPESFDKEFAAWLDKQTSKTVQGFDKWKSGIEAAHAAEKAGKTADAMREATAVKDIYPDYVSEGNAYEIIANAAERQNQKNKAAEELRQYREHGGSDVAVLKRLAHLQTDLGDSKQAAVTLGKISFVYPEDEETHRMLAKLSLSQKDVNTAVRESQAVLALKPADAAQTHYELAEALDAANRRKEAKDQVVLALEAAPDFKPAQQLLLKLSQ